MTCKDLVIYIVNNDLLDKPVFDGETFVGFITESDATEELKVGLASLNVLIDIYDIECINVGDTRFIPYDFADKLLHIRKE